MILIIGAPDIHTEHVAEKIRERGSEAVYLDSRQFPGTLQLSYTQELPPSGTLRPGPDQPEIPLSEIKSVYWYCYEGVVPVADPDAQTRAYFHAETESALGSFFRSLPCRWINPPDAIEQHRLKARQLQLMHALGLRVPDTLVTNSPEALIAFYERHQRQVICKPMASLGLLHKLADADLVPEKTRLLSLGPVQVQEFIEGTDIRVHVVGEQVFPTEILTRTEHYKTDAAMAIQPIILPESITTDCLRLARTMNLTLAGIDLRRTEAGEYVYFEANPSPQFMIYQERSGLPISDALADLLVRG